MTTWRIGDLLGKCPVCGATRRVHANRTVERHTRKIRGRAGRLRCRGTGKPSES